MHTTRLDNKGKNQKKNRIFAVEIISKKSMLESIVREIQIKLNECIKRDLAAMKDSLSLKLHYLNNEQRNTFLQQELFRITDLLVQFRKNRTIDSLIEYTDNSDFLWESAFIEHLTPDEKKKYRNFDLSLSCSTQHEAPNQVYDDNLPYFSQIIQFIALSQYINVLMY